MNRVLDRLWIGTTRDLDGATPLGALGFVAIVDLRERVRTPDSLRGLGVLRLANRDGDPWNAEQVESALEFIHRHIQEGKVLVACAAGMSRSASIVTGYLVRCGWSAAEAFVALKAARPEVDPVQSMLESVLSPKAAAAEVESRRNGGIGNSLETALQQSIDNVIATRATK